MSYPILVDALGVSLIGYGDPELAWQLFIIDLEVLGTAGLIGRAGQKLAGRKRPLQIGCEEEGPDSHKFCPGTPESYVSGHVAMSFAGAAVSCAHHANIALYGGYADTIACIGLLGAATATTSLRVNADMHWLSDVAWGAGLGRAAGFLLPNLLHYGETRSGDMRAAIAPWVSQGHLGAQYVGWF
jgi:membrane-associated phospholipid phosphatase